MSLSNVNLHWIQVIIMYANNKRGLFREPQQFVYIHGLKHIFMIILNKVNFSYAILYIFTNILYVMMSNLFSKLIDRE
jgi:hypothetical protein